ncbi:DNA mismatch repair protein spel1 isoform X2 [Oratosquilla oratoria]|uniref:DNA mismatch repair protein spel1 isoform X2 n=1 Tax=Oratosquilla oratoria TaxID=337810 RepID=UPI003F761A45
MAAVQPKEALSLDGVQEQGFLSYLKNLPQKPSTTVRLFDRGEFYSVHGPDAHLAAREVFKTSSAVKQLGSGSNKVDSLVLSQLNFEAFVRTLLLVKQYRVEVYSQQQASKNEWKVQYKASPGNLMQFEDVLFGMNNEQTISTGVLAIKTANEDGQRVVGTAYTDVSGRFMTVSEFNDGDTFSNLEALIVHLDPKECILPSGDLGPDGVKIKQVLSRSNLLVTERKKVEFSFKDVTQDLGRLLKKKESAALASRPEFNLKQAMGALSALIKYLELLNDERNFGHFSLETYELSQYMHLNSAAKKALHVEPIPGETVPGSKTTTILGILDKCHTPQGHRLLAQWLRQPLVDVNRIEERLDLVEAFVSSTDLRQSLGEDHLRRIPDIQRIARKLSRKGAALSDCYKLYQCVERLPHLCEAIGKYCGKHEATLSAVFSVPLQESVGDLAKYQEMIETTVDTKKANEGDFVVKPDFDEVLSELREKMDELEKDIQRQVKKVASDLCLDAGKTLKLESNAQLGYFFRVTLKEEKALRNNRSYHMIDANKSGVRFRNSALQDLNDQYLSAKEEYVEQQKSVVEEIINIAAGYIEVFQQVGHVLSTLDCIYALASAAVSAPIPYVRPKLHPTGTGVIKITAARHPCLELQDDISFIPNDCCFDKESGLFHILTGPNMGGKSTYIRSVGMAVLMAQIGSFVPCEEAELSIVDSILARVGAGDYQSKGVSTFMAEMLETATILRSATKDSLVIIDELGRGTSTYDGFGLAWAISWHICKEIGSFCLFATHFHELTALEDMIDTAKNFHVTATTANNMLTLLYQVQPGPCDRSFGIHVAQLADFPKHIIEVAKRKAEELEDSFINSEDSKEELPKKKVQKQEGEKIINDFVSKAAKLDINSFSDEALLAEINQLCNEVEKSENKYIAHLLART